MCVVAGAVGLAACGGSSSSSSGGALCDKAAAVGPSLNQKIAPCVPAGTPAPVNIPSGTTCVTALAQCTSADQAILSTFLDCVNAVPTCSTTTQTAFLNAVTALSSRHYAWGGALAARVPSGTPPRGSAHCECPAAR